MQYSLNYSGTKFLSPENIKLLNFLVNSFLMPEILRREV